MDKIEKKRITLPGIPNEQNTNHDLLHDGPS